MTTTDPSRQVHTAAVSHLDGLGRGKAGTYPDGIGRRLSHFVELPTAGQLDMSWRVANYVEDRVLGMR